MSWFAFIGILHIDIVSALIRANKDPYHVHLSKKTVLSFAKERGITVIDGKLMDEVREKVGM